MIERTEIRICQFCGNAFTAVLPAHGGLPRKYCSDECRREKKRELAREWDLMHPGRHHHKRDRAAERRRLAALAAASVPPHDCRIRRRMGVGEFGEPITIEERF